MIKNKYTINENTVTIEIIRRNGEKFNVLIDKEDLKTIDNINHKLHVGWHNGTEDYYAEFCQYLGMINGKPKYKTILLHRLVMHEENTNNKVDHINHNTLDNRKENLRVTEQNKNLKNRKSKNSNNTSGYRNVSWFEWKQKWVVQLQINGKNTLLGEFDDVDEAGAYAEAMRKKYYKEYAGKN